MAKNADILSKDEFSYNVSSAYKSEVKEATTGLRVVKNVPIKTIEFYEAPRKSMTRRASVSSEGVRLSSARRSLKDELLEQSMRDSTFETT